MMKEARFHAALQARMENEALGAKEEEKIRRGEELVLLATERALRRDDAALQIGEEEEEDAWHRKKRRANVRLGGNVFTGEVDRFENLIRESYDARIALERERLLSEQKRFEREIREWDK